MGVRYTGVFGISNQLLRAKESTLLNHVTGAGEFVQYFRHLAFQMQSMVDDQIRTKKQIQITLGGFVQMRVNTYSHYRDDFRAILYQGLDSVCKNIGGRDDPVRLRFVLRFPLAGVKRDDQKHKTEVGEERLYHC